jgi:SAM-dependent methyltransferase
MTGPEPDRSCPVCGAARRSGGEEAAVRSNVRAFRDRSYVVWRCAECLSLHARDDVDLEQYYRVYPFHTIPEDWRLRALYDHQVRRLRRAGVRRDHRILDYGCGGGAFVRHLQRRGFAQAFGYDEYSRSFSDASVLRARYDCVISQDVLEHVPAPLDFLNVLHRLTRPGGVIALGTPNAEAIRLEDGERHVHALHQPYHRHIFSERGLLAAGHERGWELERLYRTQYANTPVPFLNSRFYRYYLRLHGDCVDVLMEPPAAAPLLVRLPLTLFWGFFGFFFAEATDIMAVFRRGGAERPPGQNG